MQLTHTLFTNGKIFQSRRPNTTLHPTNIHDEPIFHDSMLVSLSGTITYIGSASDEAIQDALHDPAVTVQDLRGRTVLPGFIDGHLHILVLGQSLTKVPLDGCKSLGDIRGAIAEYAGSHADRAKWPRIFARGWMASMTPDGVDHTLLDDLDPRPIYIDTKDLHSTWCNAAALAEMAIPDDMPDPVGGKIHRGPDGKPTGLFSEAAVFTIVWPHIARVSSLRERADAIQAAVRAYHTAGYTGMIDMAMDEDIWEAVVQVHEKSSSPLAMRLAAYWLIKPMATEEERLAQVDRAIELAAKYNSQTTPNLRVVGIKIICDGIIDACTASLKEPYHDKDASNPDPIWWEEHLLPVVRKADAAGLQVALHAIGDRSIKMAIDVLEVASTPGRRPRIEHLELASAEDAARLGKLGITASIQAVHSDPAILRAWPRLIGQHRCGRAFAYREFADGGAPLALGSDAPTAPHIPTQNVYVATTRRSAREPQLEDRCNPHFALNLCEAVVAATEGSAYSSFADHETGSLAVGKRGDFVVVDMKWDPETLLSAQVKETWFDGQRVYEAPN